MDPWDLGNRGTWREDREEVHQEVAFDRGEVLTREAVEVWDLTVTGREGHLALPTGM